jgi:hypothetical protein
MDAIEPAARECGLWVYRIDNRKMGGDIMLNLYFRLVDIRL